MKKSIIFAAALLIGTTAINAQDYNKKLLSFEYGKEAEKEAASVVSYGWKYSTDVWEIDDDQNHTKDGERALKYESDGPTEKTRVASTQKKMNQLITLEDGIYQAKLWVYVEEGKLNNFQLKFPEVRIKEGKVMSSKDKSAPDFVSPVYIANVKVDKVVNGKWIQLTSAPFRKGDEKHIDKIQANFSICYPKGKDAVEFYIDDIRFVKVEEGK